MENNKEFTIRDVLSDIQVVLVAPKSQTNTHMKFKFRSCEDILNALKPLLKKHTASVKFENEEIVLIGERYYLKTEAVLCYKNESERSNGIARESDSQKGLDDSQVSGKTSSYARKYALNALFAIDDTKDADSTNKHEKVDSKPTVEPKTVASEPIVKSQDVDYENMPYPGSAQSCECGAVITDKVKKYSMDKFGKALCFNCQKVQK
jgi:hypothetical protein